MPKLVCSPPNSSVEAVTDALHGVPVTDPYRWLEEARSSRTRAWLAAQCHYARDYFDGIPGRKEIRARVRELLAVETYDSLLSTGDWQFFRKRLPYEEQPSIYRRRGFEGEGERLLDPASRGTGPYTALKPVCVSPNGRFLLYEIKQGGERAASFEILDLETRQVLPDRLSHGYLRSFWFDGASTGYFYVHEPIDRPRTLVSVQYHVLGCTGNDRVLFEPTDNRQVRMYLASDGKQLGVLLYHFEATRTTEFHFSPEPLSENSFAPLVTGLTCSLGPVFSMGRILAVTDQDAPNFRIVEIPAVSRSPRDWRTLIPECDARIRQWTVCHGHLLVFYLRGARIEVQIFDQRGKALGELSVPGCPTVRLVTPSAGAGAIFVEAESFTTRPGLYRCDPSNRIVRPWKKPRLVGGSKLWDSLEFSYSSSDGTLIPITLVGRSEVLAGGTHPVIMTSYGGFGAPMLPQFSVFVTCLIEAGCLFALPHIRGGSEFGAAWHGAAQGRRRQRAFDDFLAAAEWLISSGRTSNTKLAIFGGSHSGLLVAVAATQRPELFKAAICVAPLLDMLRYHLFDQAYLWKEELGTADDAEDFSALLQYSPYHNVHQGIAYPALLFVAGDADGNCNALHARKMTARVQATSSSDNPVLLDYSTHRGHSAVLPLSMRIDALTNRVAFVCDQLGVTLKGGTYAP